VICTQHTAAPGGLRDILSAQRSLFFTLGMML
jgi:hypothetical protein